MAASSSKLWPIVTVPIENEGDVVAVRQRAHRVAELLGFERQDQTRIATAVSELARNALRLCRRRPRRIHARCRHDAAAFRHSHQRQRARASPISSSSSTASTARQAAWALGLIGARRLMDTFSIDSKPGKGTTVEVGHKLPRRVEPWPRAKLTEIVSSLKKETSSDPLAALARAEPRADAEPRGDPAPRGGKPAAQPGARRHQPRRGRALCRARRPRRAAAAGERAQDALSLQHEPRVQHAAEFGAGAVAAAARPHRRRSDAPSRSGRSATSGDRPKACSNSSTTCSISPRSRPARPRSSLSGSRSRACSARCAAR